jgi:hypothetical protein
VIHDDSVSFTETPATGTELHDLATWLVAGDDSLITLWPSPEVLVINAPDV